MRNYGCNDDGKVIVIALIATHVSEYCVCVWCMYLYRTTSKARRVHCFTGTNEMLSSVADNFSM